LLSFVYAYELQINSEKFPLSESESFPMQHYELAIMLAFDLPELALSTFKTFNRLHQSGTAYCYAEFPVSSLAADVLTAISQYQSLWTVLTRTVIHFSSNLAHCTAT